ncbi:MAG: hypothetical protein ACYC0Q_08935 [Eubacteriales bacterium]
MINQKKKLTAGVLASATLLVAVIGIFLAAGYHRLPVWLPDSWQSIISLTERVSGKPALFVRQKMYICGDLEDEYTGGMPEELAGLSGDYLALMFPASDGWQVAYDLPRSIRVTKKVDDFCPVHARYRHLGIYRGLIAVYQGPLGCDSRLLRVEAGMPFERLSPEMQVKLQQAMEFGIQAPEAGERLRGELEFTSDESLNAALENLDEHI